MQWLSRRAFAALSQVEIIGQENIPKGGPLIVVANHFSFLDPALMVGLFPWPLEFLGGFHQPNAPEVVKIIPRLWGFMPVFRGTGSRDSLRAAETLLKAGGVLGVYPEATSAVDFLRPARPGTAFLAARTGVPVLPVGFDGLTQVFPRLRRGHRAKVTVRIGQPIGPFSVEGRGRERRRQLDAIGHQIMGRIAELLPPERRGYCSDDPALRAAAASAEDLYPWESEPETRD
jgi:1-acyl-sn-glycerol-3-phosphate acyltransferase